MGSPLSDITVYFSDFKIAKETVNFITDFYHFNLNGYKPPKTSRITISIGPDINFTTPIYLGSICSCSNAIDYKKYFKLSKIEQYKYLLDIIHNTILQVSEINKWEKSIFQNAYDLIINSNFQFEINYPKKISRDTKSSAQVILCKTETRSIIYLKIVKNNEVYKEEAISKRNHFCYDDLYKICKKFKWLNNNDFGIHYNRKDIYYSTMQNKIINKLISFE